MPRKSRDTEFNGNNSQDEPPISPTPIISRRSRRSNTPTETPKITKEDILKILTTLANNLDILSETDTDINESDGYYDAITLLENSNNNSIINKANLLNLKSYSPELK